MFKLVEPMWGVAISKSLYTWMQASAFWSHWVPVLADVFVFSYPVYLAALYIYGMAAKKMYYKVSAICIFIGVALTTVANVLIQYLVDKARPNVVLGLVDLKHKTILDKFLPTSSFPSDHAAVSMSIAVMSLIRGIQNRDKKFIWFGGILLIFSLITSFARITSAVHRPTDIIGGTLVGILVPLLFTNKKIHAACTWISMKIGKII